MNKIDLTKIHSYMPAGAIDPFSGSILCHCGLPEDNGLHSKTPTKPISSGIRDELDKIISRNSVDIDGGNNEECINDILSLLSDAVREAIDRTWDEKYKDENMEYSDEKQLFDDLRSNLKAIGLLKEKP